MWRPRRAGLPAAGRCSAARLLCGDALSALLAGAGVSDLRYTLLKRVGDPEAVRAGMLLSAGAP